MTAFEALKHDLESQVKTITVSQTLPYRLEIALEPGAYDGPCFCVDSNEFGKIENIDFNDGCQDTYPTFIDKPEELIKLQQVLSIISKYWQRNGWRSK